MQIWKARGKNGRSALNGKRVVLSKPPLGYLCQPREQVISNISPAQGFQQIVEEAVEFPAEKDDSQDKIKAATRFEIKVPTNAELAANLKGRLLLVHGDMDNNVHPANTIRLAEALIKANKRFDMLTLPGKAHGFANYQPYFTQRMWEYFAEHLLDDRAVGVDLFDRRER